MNIEEEIIALKERNKNVEIDKAWETSLLRKFLILITTYILIFILMISIGVEKPYLNALIPTVGFFLSTLSFEFLKSLWIKRYNKN